MSTREAKTTYHCYDDCEMRGCPTHEAKLTLQTVSMAYHFTAHNIDWHFDPAELEVFLKLLGEINEH